MKNKFIKIAKTKLCILTSKLKWPKYLDMNKSTSKSWYVNLILSKIPLELPNSQTM